VIWILKHKEEDEEAAENALRRGYTTPTSFSFSFFTQNPNSYLFIFIDK
jgi:hypothetical protein